MDIVKILEIVTKGITVAQSLLEAGRDAGPALLALKNFASKGGSVTQADIDATSARLDAQIAEFNRE